MLIMREKLTHVGGKLHSFEMVPQQFLIGILVYKFQCFLIRKRGLSYKNAKLMLFQAEIVPLEQLLEV